MCDNYFLVFGHSPFPPGVFTLSSPPCERGGSSSDAGSHPLLSRVEPCAVSDGNAGSGALCTFHNKGAPVTRGFLLLRRIRYSALYASSDLEIIL